MENNVLMSMLEACAKGYSNARSLWLSDRKNPFKDGRFLGYYEIKEALMHCEGAAQMRQALEKLYAAAKLEWLRDKANPFKDGKFLACYEMMNAVMA